MIKHLWNSAEKGLLVAVAYFAAGRLGLMLPAFGSHITLVWLPTGIAVAALFRWGFGCWPGIALGAFLVNLAIGTSWPAALGIAVGNTLGPVLAAWTLRRVGFHPAFDRKRDILLLAAAALLGMLVPASFGVAALTLAKTLREGQLAAWLLWWAGDATGVIAAAPLVFALTREEGRVLLRRGGEFFLWLGTTLAVTWGVFVLNRGSDGEAWALAFVPLPLVAWATLRFGAVGTSVALIALAFGAAYGTATGRGPFYRPNPIEGTVVLWVYMVTSAVLGWLISALHTARVQATGVQQLFERALSDVSLGVLLAGPDRRITSVNQGFTRLTGYTEAELLGKSCTILQGPETDPATVARLKSALHGDGFFDGEILNYRKDGTTFWNALLISPVRGEGGAMTGFLAIQRDVTKRRRAEVALHQSEEHLRTIIELEPECVKLLSPEGTLLEMNPAGLAMVEAGALEEVRGCALSELIVPEDRAAFAEMHRRVMEGASGRCEFAIVGMKGTRRYLETHAVPYRNARGEIVGALGITRDVTQSKEAASELERSLATLQLFINTVPAYISVVDAQERYRLVNKRYEEYFGRPAEQIVGQRLCDVQPPAAYAEMQPHVRAVLGGETVRYQSNPDDPNGNSRWFDVQYVPRRSDAGTVTGFFVLVFDITESKRAEIALRDSRSRLDSILNSMEDVVWSSTPDGETLLFVSASAEALYGRPAAEFVADSRKWLEVIHPEDREETERAYFAHGRGGEFDVEYRVIRPDGTVRWVHDRARIAKDETGQPLRLDGIMTDITERKVAEKALRESEERFRALIEHAPEAIQILDTTTGRFLQVNSASERLFKRSAAELSLIGPMEQSPPLQPDGRPSMEKGAEFIARTMAGEAPVFEWTHRDAEGRDILCEVRLLRMEIGGRAVVRGSVTDITERKRAEEAVQKSRQRFEQLVSSVEGIVWEADAQTFKFNFVSEQAERLLGYPVQEWMKPGFWAAHIHPDDRATATDYCATSTQQGRDHDFEYRMLAADGRVIWLRDIVTVLVEQGIPRLLRGIMVDITERKRADAALRESEVRYRLLFESNPNPMWVYDLETLRFLAVNTAAVAHYGYSRDEFLTMTIKDIRPREDVPALLANVATVEEGLDKAGVWRHRQRDGTIIDVEITSHVLEFDWRRAEVVMAQDVTERLRSEARSAGERAVLELLAANAPLPAVLTRLARTYEEIFPKVRCAVMLLDEDGRHLRHGAAPSLPEAFCRAVDGVEIGPNVGSSGTAAHTRQTTVVADIATDPRWKDYREVALANGLRACWAVPLISPENRVLGTLALYYHHPSSPTAEEIAAIERGAHFASLAIHRHELQRSLQESQVRLETLVSNLPGMAYRCQNDPSWTMTYVSDGCEGVTGYRTDELENNRLVAYGDLVQPDDREWLWAKCQASLDARAPCQNEYRIVDKHGRERWVSERASGFYAADGTLLAIDGFIQDITASRQAAIEREQLDRKMQDTQKLESLGVLAGGIAHDFNNILTAILGNASLALNDVSPGSSVHESLDQISEAALRAAELCKQMLAYSGRGRFVVRRLDLGQLIGETTQMLQISISKKAVLRFRLEKNLPPIEVDATQIRQVIMNLVINASEAIGETSGVISLTTGLVRVDRAYLSGTMMIPEIAEGDYVFLEVSDNGCGMNAETQARIFDPFFTTKFTGRGLGLAAVLGIMRGHKGAMKVYSEPGRGTTFKLLFPVASGGSEALPAEGAGPAAWHGEGTVLVVDDEETIRHTVTRMLRSMGLEPVLAADGREGAEIFRADPGRFTLVLLDLTMPHMDGEQTFTELRRLRADVRVVLMSGFNQQEALVRFTGKGLASFLQKPFTVSALRATLQDALA